MKTKWKRDKSDDSRALGMGYRYTVTRTGAPPLYAKTASEGAYLLKDSISYAPAALWRIE